MILKNHKIIGTLVCLVKLDVTVGLGKVDSERVAVGIGKVAIESEKLAMGLGIILKRIIVQQP